MGQRGKSGEVMGIAISGKRVGRIVEKGSSYGWWDGRGRSGTKEK